MPPTFSSAQDCPANPFSGHVRCDVPDSGSWSTNNCHIPQSFTNGAGVEGYHQGVRHGGVLLTPVLGWRKQRRIMTSRQSLTAIEFKASLGDIRPSLKIYVNKEGVKRSSHGYNISWLAFVPFVCLLKNRLVKIWP